MQANETSGQESDGRIDLEVTVCENGVVNVHRPESDRAHSVFVGESGDVLRCSCKGHHYRGHCSHADAIAARPLVTASARATAAAGQRVATDGGRVESTDDQDGDRFRLPEDPEHVDETDANVRDVSPCSGCGSLTAGDTCGRARCEGSDEIDGSPL